MARKTRLRRRARRQSTLDGSRRETGVDGCKTITGGELYVCTVIMSKK